MPRASAPVAAAAFLLATTQAAPPENAAEAALSNTFGLSASEIRRVQGGQVVSRTLEARDKREVATLGAVRIAMTPEFYVSRLADIAEFKSDPAILQIGSFGNPPAAEDVSALTLDERDIRGLRECRIGRCDLQLPSEAIERLRRVDWARADAPRQAESVIREMLVEYVGRYRRTGSAAMQYADRAEALDVGREFQALADDRGGPWDRFPGLREHLSTYTGAPAPATTDVVYWSKERIGRRAVLSMTHLAVTEVADGSAFAYAIGSKQIYAAHYYDASLGLTVLIRAQSDPLPATYLVYFNRSRIDVFGGPFARLGRALVSSRARSTVGGLLQRLQGALSREFDAELQRRRHAGR